MLYMRTYNNRICFNSAIRAHFRALTQQQQELLHGHNFEMDAAYLGEVNEDNWTGDDFLVTFKNTRTGKSMSLHYKTGIGHRQLNMTEAQRADIAKCPRSIYAAKQRVSHTVILPPLPLSVLQCIRLDDTQGMGFEDWCADFGYDSDSRKALSLYLACQEQTSKFRRTFPEWDLHSFEPLDDY